MLVGAGGVQRCTGRADVLIHVGTVLSKRLDAFRVTCSERAAAVVTGTEVSIQLTLDSSETFDCISLIYRHFSLSVFRRDRLNWFS